MMFRFVWPIIILKSSSSVIKFFKNVFSKKSYKLLGRGGIKLKRDGVSFYIDTNNFIGRENSIEIFYSAIRCTNYDRDVSFDEKLEIAKHLQDMLHRDGISSVILP